MIRRKNAPDTGGIGLADESRRGEDGRLSGGGGEHGLPETVDSRRVGLALMEDSMAQTLGGSNSRERWNSYADVPVRLSVSIPLARVSLNELLTLTPGTLLISEWQTTQDLPLLVGDVFLGTVSCEPAGERLGIRINSFDQPAHGL